MSLFLDIGTGSGLAGASGVRPFLPALLAGALARGDVGVDFDGTDWSFLESPAFLAAMLVLAVLAYLAERATRGGAVGGRPGRRSLLAVALMGAGALLAALLFAGSLADGGHSAVAGVLAGPPCAVLAWLAVGGLLDRVRRRLDPEAAGMLDAYAEAAALVLAAVAVLLPPLSFLALAGFVFLLLAGRRREGEKYAGLRVLR
jgi:hypothetical protein